jgi:hypothetical protein
MSIIAIVLGMAICLVMMPFALLLDYLEHFWNKRDVRDGEITKAAHGVAIALLLPVLVSWADAGRWWGYLPWLIWPYVQPCLAYRWFAVYAIMAIGAYWFILGAARSRGYRDMRYIPRAAVKFGIGCILLYANIHHLLLDLPFRIETFKFVALAGYWCIITGAVKFGLYVRGPPSRPTPRSSGQMPYGNSGFAEGLDE